MEAGSPELGLPHGPHEGQWEMVGAGELLRRAQT